MHMQTRRSGSLATCERKGSSERISLRVQAQGLQSAAAPRILRSAASLQPRPQKRAPLLRSDPLICHRLEARLPLLPRPRPGYGPRHRPPSFCTAKRGAIAIRIGRRERSARPRKKNFSRGILHKEKALVKIAATHQTCSGLAVFAVPHCTLASSGSIYPAACNVYAGRALCKRAPVRWRVCCTRPWVGRQAQDPPERAARKAPGRIRTRSSLLQRVAARPRQGQGQVSRVWA